MMQPDATDLIYPRGRIHPDLFPERALSELLVDVYAWIAEAYEMERVQRLDEAAQAKAARLWGYYRAFDAASIAMAANPATTAQTDAGSAGYAKDQRETLLEMARESLDAFEAAAPELRSAPLRTGGHTTPHVFAW